jgi:DNA-binding MarR family transcriptional regulator
VNIAAYMAALDIDDLDHMAKMAVLVIAGRANQHTGDAWVSIGRIAKDLAVNYTTAQRAFARAVEAGYLAVDKSPGRRSKWQLTSRLVHEHLVTSSRAPSDLLTTKEITRISEGERTAAALSPTESAEQRAENTARARSWDAEAIKLCLFCDEYGWLERPTGVVRCSHRPRVRVTDLTVDTIDGLFDQQTERTCP